MSTGPEVKLNDGEQTAAEQETAEVAANESPACAGEIAGALAEVLEQKNDETGGEDPSSETPSLEMGEELEVADLSRGLPPEEIFDLNFDLMAEGVYMGTEPKDEKEPDHQVTEAPVETATACEPDPITIPPPDSGDRPTVVAPPPDSDAGRPTAIPPKLEDDGSDFEVTVEGEEVTADYKKDVEVMWAFMESPEYLEYQEAADRYEQDQKNKDLKEKSPPAVLEVYLSKFRLRMGTVAHS